MKEKISKGVLWNEAAKTGVLLGIVPVVYMFLTQLVSKVGAGHAVISAFVNFILWAVKFGGCIWLMMVFMKKFAADFRADNSETFKFGCIVALCSSVIVSAVSLANVLVINPDLLASQMDAVISAYSSSLDSNSMQMLDKVSGVLPEITFFSNLIYCFLFGVVLSLILSRSIPPRNALAIMIDEMRRKGVLDEIERRAGADTREEADDQGEAGDQGEDSEPSEGENRGEGENSGEWRNLGETDGRDETDGQKRNN